jgi:hypothetical protein
VLGKFCEKLDPSLAYLAYRRAGGECDDDLIRVTNENGLFKDQARYLIEKRDGEIWAKVRTRPLPWPALPCSVMSATSHEQPRGPRPCHAGCCGELGLMCCVML